MNIILRKKKTEFINCTISELTDDDINILYNTVKKILI